MMTLATLKVETRPGERRAKGKMVTETTILAVDRFNLLIGTGVEPNPVAGKKFNPNFGQISKHFSEFGLDESHCRREVIKGLNTVFGVEIPENTSWPEMDKMFGIGKRAEDSTGELMLYRQMKQAGFAGDDDEETVESEEVLV